MAKTVNGKNQQYAGPEVNLIKNKKTANQIIADVENKIKDNKKSD